MALVFPFIQTSLAQLSQWSRNFAGFDILKPPVDVLVVIFLFVAMFLYGLTAQRKRMLSAMMSVYIAALLIKAFPYWFEVYGKTSLEPTLLRAGLFILTAFILFLLLSRSLFGQIFSSRWVVRNWLHVLLFSVLQTGLIISLALNMLSDEFKGELSFFVQKYFASGKAEFWWMISSVLGMIVVRRQKEK